MIGRTIKYLYMEKFFGFFLYLKFLKLFCISITKEKKRVAPKKSENQDSYL